MRMAQNEMSTADYVETYVQCMRVKTIGYINMTLYILLFIGFTFLWLEGQPWMDTTEFFVGMGLMFWTFGMCCATIAMHYGVAVQKGDYILPSIIMTVVTCFILVAYLCYRNDNIVSILLAVCLIYIVLSWYPMYVLYKQILSKRANASAPEPSAPMEDRPLNQTGDMRYGFRPLPNVVQNFRKAVPPHTAIDNCQSPPSYESAMGVDR